MDLKVVIDKKFAFIIFGAILILAGAIYGYAQGGSAPNPGHLSEEIWVSIGGSEMNLQDALEGLEGDLSSLESDLGGLEGDLSSLEGRALERCRICTQISSNTDIDGNKECSDWTTGTQKATGASQWAEANSGTYGGGKYATQSWIECRTY
tara:strand:+ start:104 stop:556 length:453 start_codon:yes stop_codon:yes gene_type:complete